MLVRVGVLAAACSILAASSGGRVAQATTVRCPVTVRGSARKPPVDFVRTGLPVPYVHTWMAAGGIWIRLPRNGVIPAQRDPGGRTVSAKFPWWRAVGGQVHASAQQIGYAHPRVEADVSPAADYGPQGFLPSFLRFTRPGCWRITGTLRGRSLSFVARVVLGPA